MHLPEMRKVLQQQQQQQGLKMNGPFHRRSPVFRSNKIRMALLSLLLLPPRP